MTEDHHAEGQANDDHLDEQLAVVRELALTAGAALLDGLGHVRTVERKRATEFVTDVDKRVEDLALEGLRRHFPDDAVEAEESGQAAGRSGRTWYVDPLDGTTNFAHGHPVFAFSAACADEQGLLLGAVYAPYLDELFLARRDGGAVLERPARGTSRPLPRRRPVELDQALLATGFPYVRDETVDRTLAQVGALLKAPCHGVRRAGSAAVDLVYVAAGRLDGYWEWNLRPWDSAAGTLIAREAGAVVTDQDGRELALPHRSVLAAAPGLHAEMLRRLAAAAEEA